MSNHQFPEYLLKSLQEREKKGLLRQLRTDFPTIDFCSNDYLGFSKLLLTHSDQNASSGSTGSRLISGNSQLTEDTEKKIALFHHAEAALIFNSGYDANVGLFSSVPQKNDLILFDEFIHASIYDGIRLSHANHYKFKHNSVSALKELIQRHRLSHQNIFVAVESVYSMDGDQAPLKEIVDLLINYENVYLIVDEAHAIGVFGEEGRGLCNELNIESRCFARIYTYGKAMGCHGATIAGSITLRQYLINFARSFIYTTALPSPSIKSISVAYDMLASTEEQKHLKNNIAYFNSKTSGIQKLIPSTSAIHCYITGTNDKAQELEQLLADDQIYAKAIKSPTVKEGTERLRICLHAYNTQQEIDQLTKRLNSFYNG